jgi:membrane-associated phospholipid phosphatase
MIVTGSSAGVLFLVLYALFNLTVLGQSLENSWAWRYEVFDTVGYWLSRHGLPPLSGDRATIVVGVALAVVIAAARRHGRTAVWVAVALPGAVLASEGFKTISARPLLVDSRDDAISYPSGHAVIALAVGAALLIVIPRMWVRWFVPVLGVWMAMASSAIIVIGNHRPSEIAGAALLVITVFALVGAVVQPGTTARRSEPAAHADGRPEAWGAGVARRVWVRVLIVAAIVAAGLFAAWGALPWITLVDGVAGAAASLLVTLTALAIRSWISSPPPTVTVVGPSGGNADRVEHSL